MSVPVFHVNSAVWLEAFHSAPPPPPSWQYCPVMSVCLWNSFLDVYVSCLCLCVCASDDGVSCVCASESFCRCGFDVSCVFLSLSVVAVCVEHLMLKLLCLSSIC